MDSPFSEEPEAPGEIPTAGRGQAPADVKAPDKALPAIEFWAFVMVFHGGWNSWKVLPAL